MKFMNILKILIVLVLEVEYENWRFVRVFDRSIYKRNVNAD